MLPLESLEEKIGYHFKNRKLLQRAVTHRSFGAENNERLEFLGDSVLNCVIGQALFLRDAHSMRGASRGYELTWFAKMLWPKLPTASCCPITSAWAREK